MHGSYILYIIERSQHQVLLLECEGCHLDSGHSVECDCFQLSFGSNKKVFFFKISYDLF